MTKPRYDRVKEMSFFRWYITVAVPTSFEILGNYLAFLEHFFSLERLSKSLFSPWKHQVAVKKKSSLDDLLYQLDFNLISRIVGFFIRCLTILIGILCVVTVAVFGLVLVLAFLLFLPGIVIWYFSYQEKVRAYSRSKNWSQIVEQLVKDRAFDFFCFRLSLRRDELESKLKGVRFGENYSERFPQINSWSTKYGKESADAPAVLRDLCLNNREVNDYLDSFDVKDDDIEGVLDWYEYLEFKNKRHREFWKKDYLLSLGGIGKEWAAGYTHTLDKFCDDLTKQDLRFTSFLGRDDELNRLITELSKPNKPDVIVHGKPGMGRHALIRGLAKKIQWHEIGLMKHYRILVFRSAKFLASVDERKAGEKLYQLLTEADLAGNVVLVIDNFDQLVKAGSGERDLSKAIETRLGSSKFQIVGLTTSDSFYEHVKPNDSVMKFFTEIELQPMTAKQAIDVVLDKTPELESTTGVSISWHAINALVEGCERYVLDHPFPEKALDMLIGVLNWAKSENVGFVTPEEVYAYLSQKTKIPLGHVGLDERQVLLEIEQKMSESIVEQKPAVLKIAKALRRSRAGVKTSQKPLGSFLFMGPTGVGKTEMAKALSKIYFQTEDFIRLDMAEYRTEDAINRLIGSFSVDKAGELTKKVQARPYGVLLLDEFEKALPEVHNLFLSILDEGRFTSAQGKTVDCRNLFVIATSNAGSNKIHEGIAKGLGETEMEKYVLDYLIETNTYSPELLNRFDAVVFFRPLGNEGLRQVTSMILGRLKQKMANEKKIKVEFSTDLIDKIMDQGYDPRFGARSIQHFIQDEVEDMIAQKILREPDVKQIQI